jgi:hypothetical protein
MACHLTVVFADGERLEYELGDADLAGLGADEAHRWLGEEFEAAGCVPSNPMGKLLAADKIVSLAKSRQQREFQPASPWVQNYLRAAAVALGRPVVTVDLANHSLGF